MGSHPVTEQNRRTGTDAERLGELLRTAREAQEMTLEEVEQALRIRARFLAAFEEGAYENLPGAVQARGFLRNYARFLNLDEEAVLAQFDAGQAAFGRRQPRLAPGTERAYPSPFVPAMEPLAERQRRGWGRRIAVFLGLVVGLLVLAGLCLGGTQLVERVLNTQANQQELSLIGVLPTIPTLTPSATFMPSPTPLPGARVAAGPPITDRVVLDVNVVQRTWVRVIADGETVFEGILTPGLTIQYVAQQELNIQASNGAGLDAIFNNLPIGLLGLRGEAIDTTFTPDLVLTPTPDEAPTATFTPPATPTIEGEVGAEGGSPTPLPLPGVPTAAQQEGLPPGDGPASPTLLPQPSPTPAQPTASPTPSPTPTFTPTETETPSPTTTPSPTAILPPRHTSTPVPQKQ